MWNPFHIFSNKIKLKHVQFEELASLSRNSFELDDSYILIILTNLTYNILVNQLEGRGKATNTQLLKIYFTSPFQIVFPLLVAESA